MSFVYSETTNGFLDMKVNIAWKVLAWRIDFLRLLGRPTFRAAKNVDIGKLLFHLNRPINVSKFPRCMERTETAVFQHIDSASNGCFILFNKNWMLWLNLTCLTPKICFRFLATNMLSHGNCIKTSYSVKKEKNSKPFRPSYFMKLFYKCLFYFTTVLKNLFEQFISFTTCTSKQKHVFHTELWRKLDGPKLERAPNNKSLKLLCAALDHRSFCLSRWPSWKKDWYVL